VSTLRAILVAMRPRQWTKNLLVFAALIFAGDMFDMHRVVVATVLFGLFCLLSGAVYIVNDIVDAEADRAHPDKASRPIASGVLGVRAAVAAATVLAVVSVAGCFALGVMAGVLAIGYVVLQAAYSLFLKRLVIVDAMTIAAGFVLRAVAGAYAIGVPVSAWLFLCTFLLALFLGLAKRRHELVLLETTAAEHRESLRDYSAPFIDSMLSSTVAATIVAYALYTVSPTGGEKFQYLMATVPFVVYGLFRYLYLVHRRDLGGSPEEILLTDQPLIIDILLYLVVTGVIVYVLPG
jgi:4-hydroxybenzoate polyprenyltransferase